MTAGRDRKMDPAAHEIAGSFAPTRPPTSRPPPPTPPDAQRPDAKRPAHSAGPAGDEPGDEPDDVAGPPTYTTRHDVESLGVSLETTFTAKNGRPMKIANSGKVIKELFA